MIWKLLHDLSVRMLGYEPADAEWMLKISKLDDLNLILRSPEPIALQASIEMIGSIELREILGAALGKAAVEHLMAADTSYKLVDLRHFKEWLRKNPISSLSYTIRKFDCDDYAAALNGDVTKWDSDLCFGTIWVRRPGGHALNWIITTDKEFLLVEPQTDIIFEMPENWKFYKHLYIS